MLVTLDQVKGCRIQAKDDSIGKAADFFFDDLQWTVRYLVVDTAWLFGRKVLIAPESISAVDVAGGEILLSLDKKQVEEGPGVATDLPVSRQEEIALRSHYDWPRYWELYPAAAAGAPVIPAMLPRETPETRQTAAAVEADIRERSDPNLRSADEVQGYHIEAQDGEIGHVEDFVIDDESWSMRYIVVDTRNWLPGRKVILAPEWAAGISWSDRLLRVDMTRESVRNSPPYDSAKPISRDYERQIHEYYGRTPYWA
jgi:hypothetical protein